MIAYLIVASLSTCLGFLVAALAQAAKIDALQAEIEALRQRNGEPRREGVAEALASSEMAA